MAAKKPIIVVLGMHRSGTSAIARGLQVLGVDLGDNLIGPSAGDNDKGFWEDADLNRLNDAILARFSMGYDKLAVIDKSRLDPATLAREQAEAKALIAAKAGGAGIFGFKDPRISILVPFWRGVFDDLDLDDRYVVALRNPLEVAASLKRRNGFATTRSLLLWTKHTLCAIRETKARPRVVVSYEALMDEPERELARIAAALDLPPPGAAPEALEAFRGDFLERGLKRFSFDLNALEASKEAPDFVVDLYRIMTALAALPGGTPPAPAEDALDEIEASYDALDPMLRYADFYEEHFASAVDRMTDAEAKLGDVGRDKIALAEERDRMKADLAHAREIIADRNTALAEWTAQARGLQDALSAAQALDKERQAAFAELFAHARQLGEALAEESRRLDDARRASAEKDRALADAAQQFSKAQEELRGTKALLDEAQAGAAARDRAIDQWSTHARELEATLNVTRAALDATRRSLSWRVTAPLRGVGSFLRRPVLALRAGVSIASRGAWRLVPLSGEAKAKLRDAMFTAAPALFSWSATYRNWKQAGEEAAQKKPAAETPEPAAPDAAPAPAAQPSYRPLTATAPVVNPPARLVAFYLPQFHPIPENDQWWGEGFTEWTNVRPATPLFDGQLQPRVPGELGYYDLVKEPHVRRRQAELARLHGIEAFCFYFYWFAKKRLLERPIADFAADPTLDFPFCLAWANENWTRRWSGEDASLLIAQEHSPEDDLAFIEHVARYLKHPRYLRIDGKPLLIVYRPAILPSARETAKRWRRWCRDNGVGEIYLAYTLSFPAGAPAEYGFDAAIEFPPNNMGVPLSSEPVKGLEPGFAGKMYDWKALVERSENYPTPAFKLFRGVNPSWDNTARRRVTPGILIGANPADYQRWLMNAVADAKARFANPDERLVFINGWNEWAEGAYLEPDAHYGYAYLEATRAALAPAPERVVVVTHDLYKHGAQFLALHIAKTLRERFGCEVACVSCGDGDLGARFEAIGALHRANRENGAAIANQLASEGYALAIINSAASGWMAPHLSAAGLKVVGLVNELPGIIAKSKLEERLRALTEASSAVVFPSAVVRDRVATALDIAWRNAVLLPQGLYKRGNAADPAKKAEARARVADRLKLPADARIVLGAGYADRRKGADIFISWTRALIARREDAFAIWLGAVAPEMRDVCAGLLRAAGAGAKRIRFPGFVDDTEAFFDAADLFLLTSREDPFPSTALEALAAATPVVMISGTGGIEDLVEKGCVVALPTDDAEAFADEAGRLIEDGERRRRMGEAGRDLIRAEFGFASYVGELLRAAGKEVPRISVVVPNYNYARHLDKRLGSILNQSLPPCEIIFLDDASSDDSLAVAERALAGADICWRIVSNGKNSGDVFEQWRKGVELARGEYVWIAEADDWADPRFLEAALAGFGQAGVVLAYTQSQQINEKGERLAPDYLDYVADLGAERWRNGYLHDGPREIVEGLSVKNTIPNVSAVVFRRAALAAVLAARGAEIARYRVAGDWCVYVNLLRAGKAYFDPRALNFHRRHDRSVTISRFGLEELGEIARMQAYVAAEFDVPAGTREKARAYLDNLVRHFGLKKKFSARDIERAVAGALAVRR